MKKSSLVKCLLQIFIVIHVGIILWSGFPQTSRVTNAIYQPFQNYQNFVGIWQGWDMFAPNPSRQDYAMDGVVVLQNGELQVFKFPRPYEPFSFEKYLTERYRKMVANLRQDRNKVLWNDASLFVLRKLRPKEGWDLNNLPVEVKLIRYWHEIPLLSQRFISHGELHDRYQSFHFHTYKVKGTEL